MGSRSDGDCSLPNFSLRTFSLPNFALRRFPYATKRWAGQKTLRRNLSFVLFALFCASAVASAQQFTLTLDPANTTVNITLGDVLHTVHGTFRLKRGALQLDPAAGKLTGEIVVDAKSGDTGSKMRDGKMHREVLESEQYPEIIFRPDRVEGTVSEKGKSAVKVHGIFTIHGVDREIDVPAAADLAEDHWTATLHFTIPYVKWGMKNPSALFLRVDDSVQIDIVAAGTLAPN
jgi:polyisoprenoid-binding protein YceI